MFESSVNTPNQYTQQDISYNFLLDLQHLGEPKLKFQFPSHTASDYFVLANTTLDTLPVSSLNPYSGALRWAIPPFYIKIPGA